MSENVPALDAAAAALATAPIVPMSEAVATRKSRKDKGPATERESAGGGRRLRVASAQLPDDSPVTPLGTHAGEYHYLDAIGQFRSLKARDHGNKDLAGLFAPRIDWLYHAYPQFNNAGIQTGWRPQACAEALMNACARKGVWNPLDRVRGRGAWLGENGDIVLHVGDAVWQDGAWHPTGVRGDLVYPQSPALVRPIIGPVDRAPVQQLLDLLRTWAWARPGLDPYFLIGWIAAAPFGGALDWRPTVWLTGDRGTGKSTLQRLVEGLMGGGLLAASDASEAGVRQVLGYQTLPVAVDEVEAEEDNRKLQALVKLARQASSGGRIVRGGSDHTATTFLARSCFLFSSILLPPLLPQDRSRLAILEMGPLPAGREPQIDRRWLELVGQVLRGRMIAQWPRFSETLAIYRQALKDAGHGGRGADQFGTLLAATDMALFDNVPAPDKVAEWGELLSVEALTETAGNSGDHERCLMHLRTSLVTLDGGGRPQTVQHWIAEAAREIEREDQVPPLTDDERVQCRRARRALAIVGMTLNRGRDGGALRLVVANQHQGLARLFLGTQWQARAGADGVWAQSLRRLPGASESAQRIEGRPQKCVVIPLASVIDDDGEPA